MGTVCLLVELHTHYIKRAVTLHALPTKSEWW